MVVIIVILAMSQLALPNFKLNTFFPLSPFPGEDSAFKMLGAHTFLLISKEKTAFLSEFYKTSSTSFLIKTMFTSYVTQYAPSYTLGPPHEILALLLNILFCFYSLSSKVSFFVLLWEVIFLYLAELLISSKENKVIQQHVGNTRNSSIILIFGLLF